MQQWMHKYVCAGPVSDLNPPAPRRFLLIDIQALHNIERRKETEGKRWKSDGRKDQKRSTKKKKGVDT